MRRSMVALAGALLALVLTSSVAAAAPSENSPWDPTGFRCTTQQLEAGTTYMHAQSGKERCIASL